MITKSMVSQPSTSVAPVVSKKSKNPFATGENNVFLTSTSFGSSPSYGKNMPVSGGYFAGYHNDKPNIVGRRLFIEV